jgi:hypothetical protein
MRVALRSPVRRSLFRTEGHLDSANCGETVTDSNLQLGLGLAGIDLHDATTAAHRLAMQSADTDGPYLAASGRVAGGSGARLAGTTLHSQSFLWDPSGARGIF